VPEIVPHAGELRRRRAQVRIAHDRVTPVDGLGAMPSEFVATERGTPVRSMLRTAVRRKSCMSIPGTPALRQAVRHAL
jgi:hypothetical protein